MTEKQKDKGMTNVPKIYFSGSIRGGRTDAELYKRLIDHLKNYGEVLTEHVGMSNLSLTDQPHDAEVFIYQRDVAWLRGCDVVIAECTTPSLGVGYELAYAEALHKPCYIFYDRGKTALSAMLSGNDAFHVVGYDAEEQVYEEIDRILKDKLWQKEG